MLRANNRFLSKSFGGNGNGSRSFLDHGLGSLKGDKNKDRKKVYSLKGEFGPSGILELPGQRNN
jgi:hypothetical protein